jgi:triphosphoribosyl-dephospho-CoA synthetase
MASLERRLKVIEAERKRGKAQLVREALGRLSDEELKAAEESLLAEARARGEEPPPNELLEQMKQWEAETIERHLRHAEESRRRGRELLERNHALIEAHRRRTKKGATQ